MNNIFSLNFSHLCFIFIWLLYVNELSIINKQLQGVGHKRSLTCGVGNPGYEQDQLSDGVYLCGFAMQTECKHV